MERRGEVGLSKHRKRKDEILMDDYGILNTMDEDDPYGETSPQNILENL